MAACVRRASLLLVAICIASLAVIGADDVLGCGGFVKSDIDIDFVRVEVKLFTKQGSLKYQTDCAPNNGYYFLPLYDKGEYILRVSPPEGWSFNPTEVPLKVDGATDPCSRGQDVNFVFRGFTLSGRVLSSGLETGPENVPVLLTKHGSKDVPVRTTTGPDGGYSFEKVMPGNYEVSVRTPPTWKMARAKADIRLERDNGVVADPIVVAGYDVSGRVASDDEPVQGVRFILFSSNGPTKVDGCDKTPLSGFTPPKGKAVLCHVASGPTGQFVFPSVPPGSYKLVPFYKSEHIRFDVEPTEVAFQVGHQSVSLPDTFQVKGFAVSGLVTYCKGCGGVPGARIHLDGKEVAITNKDGLYHLENMRVGTYTFQVQSPSGDVRFQDARVKIAPSSPSLPEISAASFKVCGGIEEEGSHGASRRVVFKGESGAEQFSESSPDGQFCLFLPPGNYGVRVLVPPEEEGRGVRFTPDVHRLQVKDRPVNTVRFSQLKATVRGGVTCLDKCDGVTVTLRPLDGSRSDVSIVVDKSGRFEFRDVLPGRYEAMVKRDDWCWVEGKVQVTVAASVVDNVSFRQTGFVVSVSASHETLVKYTGGTSGEMTATPVFTQTCLPKPGVYEFTTIGCHTFTELVVKYDTSRPTPVRFTAATHLVTGHVSAKEAIPGLQIRVKSGGREAAKVTTVVEKDHMHRFEYHAKPNDRLDFEPMADKFLFEPVHASVTARDECMLNAVRFQAQRGKFISGRVTPPLAGVTVTITSNGLDSPIVVQTDAGGKFSVGPLRGEFQYQVLAEKKGYVLKSGKGEYDFSAQKLGEVVVMVTDEQGQPLQGVLLSLSGGTNYRRNSQTKADGRMVFSSLNPSDYFLKPILKEYLFEPNSQMLRVVEVESVEVKLVGKRVAFSCMGSVTSITGEPEPGVVLEAVGQGKCAQNQEEAASEQEGTFRIRGLVPKCEYTIRLKHTDTPRQHVERLSPSQYNLTVSNEDIHGVHLIAFRPFLQMDVTGSVDTNPEFLRGLRVRLFQDGSPDSPLHLIKLDQSPFFLFPPVPLDHNTYIVQLDSPLPRSQYLWEMPEGSFKANQTYRHVWLKFHPQLKSLDQELGRGSYLTLPLLVILVVLCVNHQRSLRALMEARRTLQGVLSAAAAARSDRNAGEEAAPVMVEPITRRKLKPRKT